MSQIFRIHQTQRNSDQQNRRFHKIMYTAALRLGVIPRNINGYIDIEFDGVPTNEVQAHERNDAYRGTLFINGYPFDDVILISYKSNSDRPNLVTFWPVSQHPDAKHSYTDPLVDTAMDGTAFDINLVATVMHEKFRENAGVSPATLMKILYDQENQSLRDGALRIGQLLDESMVREKEMQSLVRSTSERAEAESARANIEKKQKEEAQAENRLKDEKIAQLLRDSLMTPRYDDIVTESNVATIKRVSQGNIGRSNQRAIILHMSDGTNRANNWERGYNTRLELAEELCTSGKKVRTDVWNKPGTNYKWENWFKNIYVVD